MCTLLLLIVFMSDALLHDELLDDDHVHDALDALDLYDHYLHNDSNHEFL